MKDCIIEIKKLDLGYDGKQEVLLQRINLEVNRGEIIVLFGDNGVGKSTLIKALCKHLTPFSGEILIENRPLEQWTFKELSTQLALVLSSARFSPLLSVWEFISFGRFRFTNWLGVQTTQDKKIINEILEVCNIHALKSKKMTEISDGEKQKVFLARALAQETPILILDEPTTHLDVKNTMAILKLLSKLSKEQQKTIIFSSHRIEESASIANKVWLFHEQSIHPMTPQVFKSSKEYQEIVYGEK